MKIEVLEQKPLLIRLKISGIMKVAVPVASAEVFEDQVVSGRCYCECVPGMLRFANASDVLALI
ncbi:MAG: hypothetical protein QXW58_04285, partial [Thermosphaera sp.]